MAIAAKSSAAEIRSQVNNRFVGKSVFAILLQASAVDYTPGVTDDATFLATELTPGVAGYQRQLIDFNVQDLTAYNDDGVGLATKASIFSHDGGQETMDFSHAALIWASGNVATVAVNSIPTTGIDGTYTNVPVDSSDGSGESLAVDITIVDSGEFQNDYTVTVKGSGAGYSVGELILITEDTLLSIGAIPAGAGPLAFEVVTLREAASAEEIGSLISVARTAGPVVMSGGNEAVFYWNLKQYQIAADSPGANTDNPDPEVPAGPAEIDIQVFANGTTEYILTGDVVGPNATINAVVGDTINLTNLLGEHPIAFKTAPTVGDGVDYVTTGLPVAQGATNGTASWDTGGVVPGTYYYQCNAHADMGGLIELVATGTTGGGN